MDIVYRAVHTESLYKTDHVLYYKSIRTVPRPSHLDTRFRGLPVSSCKCWDGSQDSKLLLRASHAALPI